MSEVTNSDLLNVLMDIKGDIGSLKQASAGHTAWMTKHVEDDEKLAKRIGKLELSSATQAGRVSALALLGTVLGTLASWLVAAWLKTHGK